MTKKDHNNTSKKIVFVAFGIIAIIATCIFISVRYVQKALLREYESSAVNSAKLVERNFHITDAEVEHLKTLTFEQLQADSISAKLANMVVGLDSPEPIVSVYAVCPVEQENIKYCTDETNADFWNTEVGTPLDSMWLLNIGINQYGKERRDVSDDIYRYTVTTEQLKELYITRDSIGQHTVDEWGDVISGYTPLYTEEGNFVGMFGIDYDVKDYHKEMNRTICILLSLLIVALCAFAGLFIWIYCRYIKVQKQKKLILEEEKDALSSILNNIQIGVYVYRFMGEDISVLNANSFIIKMLGRDPQLIKTASSGDITKYIHKDDKDIVKEFIKELRITGNTSSSEFRILNKNTNQYMWVVARGKSIESSDGSVIAYVTYTDDTERKSLQGIENKLIIEQAANKAKTEFLSNMSHDMRTPMNGILGTTTLMLDQEDLPSDVRKQLNHIQMSGKYLLNLINDTLDVSKIEANKLELHPVISDAYKLTENIKENAYLLASEKGVNLTFTYVNREEMTPTILFIDESRVEQIFMNLISNAVKFTPVGGDVFLALERLETTEEYSINRYTVRDTGIGMNKEFLSHIYEPFVQEGRMHIERESGTGLGLTIVYQLVKLMNGDITVESEMGKGTTFTVTMKFDKYKGKEELPKAVDVSQFDFTGKHVLLCEDHPLNRQIALRLLEKKGMIVDLAEDGEAGLQKFVISDPFYYDFILMDVRMPVMDGLEATRQIRKTDRPDAKKVPIIAMTANAFEEDVKNCLDAGMNAHLSKPIEVTKMYQVIDEYVNKNEA